MINKEELTKKIIDELDIAEIPKESQENIIAKLGESVLKKLTIDIFSEIPKNERAELENMMKSGNMDETHKFLDSKIPNLDDFVNKSIKNTVDEFKKITSTI